MVSARVVMMTGTLLLTHRHKIPHIEIYIITFCVYHQEILLLKIRGQLKAIFKPNKKLGIV